MILERQVNHVLSSRRANKCDAYIAATLLRSREYAGDSAVDQEILWQIGQVDVSIAFTSTKRVA